MITFGVTAAVGLGLLAVRNFTSAHAQEPDRRSRSVAERVREARAASLSEIILPHVILCGIGGFEGIADALTNFTFVEAVLKEKRTTISGPDGDSLQTYLWFEEIQTFASPHIPNGSMPEHVPQDLQNIPSADFIIGASASGEMVIDNVRVRSDNANDLVRRLVVGQKYLMFTRMSSPKFGSLIFDLDGVFTVAPDDSLLPLNPHVNLIAEAFEKASVHSVHDAQAIGVNHVHTPRLPRHQ